MKEFSVLCFQIEGLKGENENEGEKSERREDEDKPIDVDDDFAADLEGIDKDERNGNVFLCFSLFKTSVPYSHILSFYL